MEKRELEKIGGGRKGQTGRKRESEGEDVAACLSAEHLHSITMPLQPPPSIANDNPTLLHSSTHCR